MPGHIALLGDSIFDNRHYTLGEPDVVEHLRASLPPDWNATLLAIDGSTTHDVGNQYDGISPDVTRVVLSLGGNDALQNTDILDLPVRSTAEALLLFGRRVARFEQSYRSAISSLLDRGKPTTVCTIYNGNLDAVEAPTARVALMLFNDVILRVAFEIGLPVIDLRAICSEPSDYANSIEPSGAGGRKIAAAIFASLGLVAGDIRTTRVYAG